jgi:putative membrane protein
VLTHHHPLLRILIVVAIVAVVVALVAFLVVRFTKRRAARNQTGTPPAGAPIEDAAVGELRLRYARGELSRPDFLQALADLGVRPPEPSPTPA